MIHRPFPPYLLGALVNFSRDSPEDKSYFVVHDQYCTLQELYHVHALYKAVNLPQKPNDWVVSTIHYGSVNSFKCTLVKEVRSESLFPYLNSKDNWSYTAGLLDMSSELIVDTKLNDLRLIVHSKSADLLLEFFRFARIPATMNDLCLEIVSTNVLDLLGQLPEDCSKRKQLTTLMQGHEKVSPCFVFMHDDCAVIPSKARLSDVGYDISIIRKHSDLNDKTALYDTGLSLQIPFRFYAELFPRSSLSKSGYMLANSVGIIDRSYQGPLLVALTRVSDEALDLEKSYPFRCCQLVFRRQEFVDVLEPKEAIPDGHQTTRGEGGFGSTGV